jgi:hypothetical protein
MCSRVAIKLKETVTLLFKIFFLKDSVDSFNLIEAIIFGSIEDVVSNLFFPQHEKMLLPRSRRIRSRA